ncbi:hypothetical protein DFA_08832 [Cavenderia fasciculata]|uniref:G domain-containing protein n=1 Tax=Cavenderia fasciculata TaxID=261658 RepID=F4Q4I2_CACFS|nr:uncharacterized protein DFA_08832 [Cavenderia fasciculata]EGG17831.1 hypothetical protein DFA_08832 [Cavenderia fasciculata]|eukprot:XP_004356315.1 hypothetical protein DFA_08832 [Cavenderia fasciculata]
MSTWAGTSIVRVTSKSTFINTLTNYFKNGSFPDKIKVSIETKYLKSTEGLGRKGHRVRPMNGGVNYEFIDSPGLSDTRGGQQDEINMTKILDAVSNPPSLCAIIIISGKDSRNVLTLRNAVTRLQGSIPDVVLQNLVIVFTKCRADNRNFDQKSLGNLQTKSIFYMENSAFSTDPANWTKGATTFLKPEFNQSMHTVEKLLGNIQKKAGVATQAFADMKSMRFKIKQTVS